jgi:hypothetical protein
MVFSSGMNPTPIRCILCIPWLREYFYHRVHGIHGMKKGLGVFGKARQRNPSVHSVHSVV